MARVYTSIFHSILTLQAPTPEDGQTHSNNSNNWSANEQPTNCLSMFDHFVGLAVKGLSKFLTFQCL